MGRPWAKPLKGFSGAGVLEIVADADGNAFRAVYTVWYPEVVYVLHAFQKKSRRRATTPTTERDLVASRLARAREDYEQWLRKRRSL